MTEGGNFSPFERSTVAIGSRGGQTGGEARGGEAVGGEAGGGEAGGSDAAGASPQQRLVARAAVRAALKAAMYAGTSRFMSGRNERAV